MHRAIAYGVGTRRRDDGDHRTSKEYNLSADKLQRLRDVDALLQPVTATGVVVRVRAFAALWNSGPRSGTRSPDLWPDRSIRQQMLANGVALWSAPLLGFFQRRSCGRRIGRRFAGTMQTPNTTSHGNEE